MFNEVHGVTQAEGAEPLAFIDSLNIVVYPCGRRKSDVINPTNDPQSVSDNYQIPFDPEARLNTEANNRKHAGLNGFTQTYLDWEPASENSETLTVILAGYSFKINLAKDYASCKSFCEAFTDAVNNSTADKIYANIIIESLVLFEGFETYYTEVLRNQSNSDVPSTNLDLIRSGLTSTTDLETPGNYYFSGLSFSAVPLALVKADESLAEATDVTRFTRRIQLDGNGIQQIVSLCILEKVNNEWQIHQPALLPKVAHGDTEDSVKVKTLEANNLKIVNGNKKVAIPALELVDTSEGTDGSGPWQLQFSFGE